MAKSLEELLAECSALAASGHLERSEVNALLAEAAALEAKQQRSTGSRDTYQGALDSIALDGSERARFAWNQVFIRLCEARREVRSADEALAFLRERAERAWMVGTQQKAASVRVEARA